MKNIILIIQRMFGRRQIFFKRLNLKGVSQIFLAVLLAGMAFSPAQPTLAAGTYTVNRADDIAPRGTGVTCITAASSDCTLREAVIKANANPGSTIQFAAALNGTPIVLTRIGNDATASAGDLDINASTNIVGNGSSNTIIQAAANASYTGSIGDKVFGINQDGTFNSLTVNFSGVTIRYGDNNVPNGDPSFAYTGGGVDVFQTGIGNVTTFTDCVISFNRNRNSYGGGLNFDQLTGATGSLSLTNVTFDSNKTLGVTGGQSTGGALNIFGVAPTVTITNSTFTNNLTTPTTAGGGAIYYRPTNGGSLSIHNSDIYSNTSGGIGGGIYVNISSAAAAGAIVTIDQGTRIRNNVSGGVSGGSAGGSGIFLGGSALTTTPMLLSKITISGNSESALAASHNGGGGILVERANITVQYSRIVSNTISGGSTGTGLFKSIDTGAVTAINNWWGCSTGPGSSPCDTAVIAGGSSGSLSSTPYFRDLTTPGSSTLVTNQTTSLTASVNTNSAGADVSANVDRLLGLPVTWSAVNGTISGADATISPSGGSKGTAAATFTATTVGAGKGIAKVDNDSTTGAGSNIASITINKANTTAAITSDLPDPSVTGEPVIVSYTVTGAFGNSPTAPTGNVTVSDGTNSCIGTVAAGSCAVTFTSAGSKTLTATYVGDGNFNASPASAGVAHLVNKADTTTTITSDTPDPSVVGQPITFHYSVAVNAPGAGTLTGNVTVTDGSNTCTGTVAAGSCMITFTAPGSSSFTATYAGDTNFNGSASASASHTVNKADTTTTITSDTPDPSVVGGPVTFNYSVAVVAPGAGTLTGNVTVTDGSNTCTGTVAAGSCVIAFTAPGASSFTATYAGDSNFNGSASAGASHTVNKADTTTTVTSDPNPSLPGQTATFTATVSAVAPGSGTPAGNVTFFDNGASLGTSALSGGMATFATSSLLIGFHPITATYTGYAGFNVSTSDLYTHTVGQADTGTTLTSSANPAVYGQPVTLTATVTATFGTATGSVDFYDDGTLIGSGALNGSGIAALSTASLSLGTHPITATYAGNVAFNGSTSGQVDQVVNQASTTTTVTSSANPAVFGQNVTLTAAVTADAPSVAIPAGSVTLYDNGTALGTFTLDAGGSATFSTSAFTVGSHPITATYAGNTNFGGSTSNLVTQVVSQASSSVALNTSGSPITYGEPATFTATVSPSAATGTVTFKDSGADITGCINQAVSGGTATCAIGVLGGGSYSITAVYSGDTNYTGSTSNLITQLVNQASSSVALTTSGSPIAYGELVTFTATTSPLAASGTVTFKDGGVDITGCINQAVSGGTATCATSTLSVGSHSITAVYSGDANYLGSTSPVATQVVYSIKIFLPFISR